MGSTLFLIRHGQTEWSLSGRHTGSTDLPLTGEGERRAILLRAALAPIRFDRVLTSPRLRARRTCTLAGLDGHAEIEPDLHEWNYGAYEGLTTAEIRTRQAGWDVFDFGCPQGESVAQASDRADRLLARIGAMDGTVALFSHAHFLRVLAVRWIGLPVAAGRHFELDTASLGVLGHEHPDSPVRTLIVWNAGPCLDLAAHAAESQPEV